MLSKKILVPIDGGPDTIPAGIYGEGEGEGQDKSWIEAVFDFVAEKIGEGVKYLAEHGGEILSQAALNAAMQQGVDDGAETARSAYIDGPPIQQTPIVQSTRERHYQPNNVNGRNIALEEAMAQYLSQDIVSNESPQSANLFSVKQLPQFKDKITTESFMPQGQVYDSPSSSFGESFGSRNGSPSSQMPNAMGFTDPNIIYQYPNSSTLYEREVMNQMAQQAANRTTQELLEQNRRLAQLQNQSSYQQHPEKYQAISGERFVGAYDVRSGKYIPRAQPAPITYKSPIGRAFDVRAGRYRDELQEEALVSARFVRNISEVLLDDVWTLQNPKATLREKALAVTSLALSIGIPERVILKPIGMMRHDEGS